MGHFSTRINPFTGSLLHAYQHLGILEEISGKKRDKIYVYRNYLNILETGAKPIYF